MMKAFKEIFQGLNSAHGQTVLSDSYSENGKQKTKSFTVKKPVTDDLWENHLKGKEPGLGIVPINENNKCRWGCIDIDEYNFNHKKLIKLLNQKDLPLIVFRSKSGGAHLFLFTKEPVEASLMRLKLKLIAAHLGYSSSEIFPKQETILIDRGDTGNFLNLPYHGGDKSTRYAFLANGDASNLNDFIALYNKRSLTKEQLENLHLETKNQVKNGSVTDGPPCLQTLCSEGFPEGSRNDGLYNIGVYLKKAKPDTWKTELENYNNRFMKPPLRNQEVETVKKSLDKKDYQYKCKSPPICNFCDSITCQTRKFGIGRGNLMPELTNLRKYTSEPPLWFLDVNGKTVDVDTDTLYKFDDFSKACMGQINVLLPHIGQNIWKKNLALLFPKTEDNEEFFIQAPESLKPENILRDHLEDFITDSYKGNKLEDICNGSAFSEDGVSYFKFKDFWKFLKNTNEWNLKRTKTVLLLKKKFSASEDKVFPKVGDKTIDVRVFRMPEPVEKVVDKKAPEIEKAKWQKK